MFFSIHYLRGIAALFVVFYHFRFTINNVYSEKDLGDLLFDFGYFGVDLFFMISGFVMVLSTKENTSKMSFFMKRFFRIYPLYFFVLILFLLTSNNDYNIVSIIKSFLLVHLNYDSMAPFFSYSIIDSAWTLTYEVTFYFLLACFFQKSI
ncbi:acyltransferase [Xenorhabdus sp. Reich]|uniref:Acyltransferase n=1 Tax=Xenorhabdus littoralis TaxID=2582835 RepID=A0ABU4SJW8_9GAMM|nr:acyltransferase [Xenorhabdus sp. Reich]